MSWGKYWEGDSSVYVGDRHKAAHYERLAEDLLEVAAGVARSQGKPLDQLRVLDFGCGEALAAERIAARVAHLTLSDGSARVRDQLAARFGGLGNVTVATPEQQDPATGRVYDLVIVNSVLQYVEPAAAGPLLASLARALAPDGRVLVGDIIPPDLSAAIDAWELIAFAARDGFLLAALAGLVRTAVSDYAKIRAKFGLTRYSAADFEQLAAESGLVAELLPRNVGHNQHRLAFLVRRGAAAAAA